MPSYGFNDQDVDWNAMPEEGMHGLWLFPESLEELRSTLEANNKSPLEKCPGPCLVVWYTAGFWGRNEVCFPERWQGGTLTHNGNLKNLKDTSTAGKGEWQLWGVASVKG